MENSIGNFIELSKVKSADKISSEVVLGIQKDWNGEGVSWDESMRHSQTLTGTSIFVNR